MQRNSSSGATSARGGGDSLLYDGEYPASVKGIDHIDYQESVRSISRSYEELLEDRVLNSYRGRPAAATADNSHHHHDRQCLLG